MLVSIIKHTIATYYNFLNVLFLRSMPFPYSNLKCVLDRNPLYNWVVGLCLGSPSNCMAMVL